ncbi:LrgB family protein [Marinospirillum perlucidum]|uniref:LrgB family protein n=1 Tax=Marinospirillum perlucidum TaxID=1982602 RepID=UPI000DF3E1E7|nr:LrgB family protein [Marinospirillum perlucidum]
MADLPEVFSELWVYLTASKLLYLLLTLVAFMLAQWINRRAGGTPFLHPVLVAIALIVSYLLLTDTNYGVYFEGAQFIHFLLGPAIVALAVPLFDHRERIRREFLPLMLACVAGILTAVFSTMALVKLLGGREDTLMSLAPKSVTSPIAMGIAEQIGGYPALAAGIVLITGAIGCVLGPPIFRLLKIEDHAVQGFAMGLAAHGFGTAQSFTLSNLAGAFAGLSMGVTGLLSAFLIPILVRLF